MGETPGRLLIRRYAGPLHVGAWLYLGSSKFVKRSQGRGPGSGVLVFRFGEPNLPPLVYTFFSIKPFWSIMITNLLIRCCSCLLIMPRQPACDEIIPLNYRGPSMFITQEHGRSLLEVAESGLYHLVHQS